jgi:uncharacterized protein
VKIVWFVLAWIFFAIGIIGAFVPILPTTPFLLLSALLFSKSSPRFHKWLLELPVAGEGIRDWQNNKVIRPQAKFLCSIMIIFSLVLIMFNQKIMFAVKLSVGVLLISVWIFVISRKSYAED